MNQPLASHKDMTKVRSGLIKVLIRRVGMIRNVEEVDREILLSVLGSLE